jgi:hypothetical protein
MADELPELEGGLAELVQAYRAETAREPAQVEAALARVTASVGDGATAAAGGLSVATKVGLVAIAITTVVGAGVLGWGSGDAEPLASATDPATTRVVAATNHKETRRPIPPPAAAEVVMVDEHEASADPIVDATPSPAPARRARARATDPDPSPPPSTLREELELMRAARTALREGRAREALALLERHARTYPSSTLAEERAATEVSALCALDRIDDAKREAAAFERRFPRSSRDLLGDCQDEDTP